MRAGAPAPPAAAAGARRRPPAAPPRPPRCAAAAPAPPSAPASPDDEVSIRRNPPGGAHDLACGRTFDFTTGVLQPGGGMADDDSSKPRNILEEIVWHKAVEVARWKERTPLEALRRAALAAPPPRDFAAALRAASRAEGLPGLIAEVKKASPSRGVLQPDFDAVRIAKAYAAGGAACLSVLTDEKFFQGSFENLAAIRASGVQLPLLAKEFVVEPYQLFKARASGADAVLLIAAVLPSRDVEYLAKIAHALGLQVLLEVHTEAELGRAVALLPRLPAVPMLGVNNRDLGTFVVDLGTTPRLLATPAGVAAVAAGALIVGESGVFGVGDMRTLRDAGATAALVGEGVVTGGDQAAAVRRLYGKEA